MAVFFLDFSNARGILLSAETYTAVIASAQQDGSIRSDVDARLLAFLFDNLLTTLQFSYCCDYYEERLKIYCPDAWDDDEAMVKALLAFLRSAF